MDDSSIFLPVWVCYRKNVDVVLVKDGVKIARLNQLVQHSQGLLFPVDFRVNFDGFSINSIFNKKSAKGSRKIFYFLFSGQSTKAFSPPRLGVE